jgi:hypothetical protein
MKHLSIAVLGLLLAAGCSSSSSSPSTTTSGTTTTRFTATLSPANETPPITNAEQTGTGVATIDLNITRDASGTITAQSINFQVNMSNFPSTTVVNIAHIHTGAAGVAGPVLVSTTLNAGEVVLTNGAGNFTRVGVTGGLTAAVAQSFIDNPAGFYFNVHTTLNPGGVMRGQLVKQ